MKEKPISERNDIFSVKNDLAEVAKQIKEDRPFSTVAVFCSQSLASTAISLCYELRKIGNKPVLLILEESFKFSVQSVKDYFALPENVRATVVLSQNLLNVAKYFSNVKNAHCYFIPLDGVPLGIYDGVGSIFDDGKLFKVMLKKPKVFLIKSFVEKNFFKNATLTLMARAFLLKDYTCLDDDGRDALIRAVKGVLCGDYESLINYSFIAERFVREGSFIKSIVSVAAYYAYGNLTPTETLIKATIGECKRSLCAEKFIPENFNDCAREISFLTGLPLDFALQQAAKCFKNFTAVRIDEFIISLINKIFKDYEIQYGKVKSPTEREKTAVRLALNNFNIFV